MKRNTLIVVIGAVLVAIAALLLFVFQVRQSEVVVVTTFGKPTAQPYDKPGAYLKWPKPIQFVYRFDQRIQNFEDKYSENMTSDFNNLMASVYVGWKISDASRFLLVFPGGSVPDAQQRLEGMLRTAKIAVIAQHPLADFVNADPKELKFESIEKEIELAVQTQLQTNNCGMQLEFLGFKKIGLPESVTQTVFDRMKAERQKYISLAQYQGEAEATKIKSAADRQAADTINNANATAIRIQGEGEAEAAKVLPVFQQNPELAVFLFRIGALQQSLNQKATLIFDERTPPFDLFTGIPASKPAK